MTTAHDTYTARGPDGQQWPTWHPQVDPITGEVFDHEHGDDPATSLANPVPPLFGYVSSLAGHDELARHGGHKVAVGNAGQVNKHGYRLLMSSRVVFHQGTGGANRFTESHHYLQVDVVGPSGHTLHVGGMAETGEAMSIFERDAGDPHGLSRVVMLVPDPSRPTPPSAYEIWLMRLTIRKADGSPAAIVTCSPAVFDPITIMDPANLTIAPLFSDWYQGGTWPEQPHGALREVYHGPYEWRNPGSKDGRQRIYYETDPFGAAWVSGPKVVQVVSAHALVGVIASGGATPNPNQWIENCDYRAAGLGLRN